MVPASGSPEGHRGGLHVKRCPKNGFPWEHREGGPSNSAFQVIGKEHYTKEETTTWVCRVSLRCIVEDILAWWVAGWPV